MDGSDSLLHVGLRLNFANISNERKHPILLQSQNHVEFLMIKYEHERLGHPGASSVLLTFHLNGLRQTKKIIRNCTICFRFRALCGGFFYLRSSLLRKPAIFKSYEAIFACMVTKAVRIEVVTNLSTDLFIMAFKRFISQ